MKLRPVNLDLFIVSKPTKAPRQTPKNRQNTVWGEGKKVNNDEELHFNYRGCV